MPFNSAHYQIAKFLRSENSIEFKLDAIDALILRCIADYIDMSDKKECRAFLKTIAFECKYSTRWLSNRLITLCEKNLLRRERRWKIYCYFLGNYFTSRVDLSLDNSSHRQSVAGLKDTTSDDHRTNGQVTIEEDKKNKRERVKDIAHTTFNFFWDMYPRKVSKQKAEKIWIEKNLFEIAETIINDIKQRSAADKQWQDKQYIPYPSTYLSEGRWTDEINEVKNEGPKGITQLNRRQASIQGYIDHLERSRH